MNMGWIRTVAVGSMLICGCSLTKPRPAVHHYTLTLTTIPEAATQATKSTLVVRPFSANEPYNQERLAYRTSPYQLDFYSYHRWAALPAEQVADWTRRYLRDSALFARVYPTGEGIADFALGGRIRQFDEIDNAQSWDATLSLDFWLTGVDQRKPLWSQSYVATQQTAKRNPAAVAEAMSRNLEIILGRLVGDLAPVVAASPGP
jgi:ABC-type uncharacterized transport system auxiliary subunit